MDLNNILNAFMGSPVFSILMIIGIIALGIFIRMSLLPTNNEYKHRPDKE